MASRAESAVKTLLRFELGVLGDYERSSEIAEDIDEKADAILGSAADYIDLQAKAHASISCRSQFKRPTHCRATPGFVSAIFLSLKAATHEPVGVVRKQACRR